MIDVQEAGSDWWVNAVLGERFPVWQRHEKSAHRRRALLCLLLAASQDRAPATLSRAEFHPSVKKTSRSRPTATRTDVRRTDGCRTCRRPDAGEPICPNIGIAAAENDHLHAAGGDAEVVRPWQCALRGPNSPSKSRRHRHVDLQQGHHVPRDRRGSSRISVVSTPHGTMPVKCVKSIDVERDAVQVTQRRRRMPIAAILSSASAPRSGRGTHTRCGPRAVRRAR